MGGMIPLRDASRRPAHSHRHDPDHPGERHRLCAGIDGWRRLCERVVGVPAQIASGHHWITVVTAMFMHASWSHIIGNMIFLWAFAPEIEDAMGRGRYLVFYLVGGLVAMLAQVVADPHSTVPNLGASGAIAAVMGAFLVTYPRDRIRVDSHHLRICADHIHPGRTVHRLLVPYSALQCRSGGARADGRSGVPGAHRRLHLRSGHGALVRRSAANRFAKERE